MGQARGGLPPPGEHSDQALFLERALKIKDTDVGSLEGAAEARIALGAPKEALVHIQKAYAVRSGLHSHSRCSDSVSS